MVLEMGEPVRILDVAKRMISLSGATGVEIVFTGLRPGEKLHEVLFSDDESRGAHDHPMIRAVSVPPIDPAELSDLTASRGRPVTERIYLSSPDVTQAEEDALVRALRSGWVAPLGPEVDAFEAELAEFDRTLTGGRPVARAPPPSTWGCCTSVWVRVTWSSRRR